MDEEIMKLNEASSGDEDDEEIIANDDAETNKLDDDQS